MKHASIVPLIGGETLASQAVFDDQRPEYILSYKAFGNNDAHLLNHYNHDVPYHVIDSEDFNFNPSYVDVVSTVCPCAGLSSLSTAASADSPTNDWMLTTAEYVFENIAPRVFWGENAPGFATNLGEKIRNKLRELGAKYGYTMTVYRTKSLDHGLSQYRGRSFYFFWKEDGKVPLMNYYKRDIKPIEELLDEIKSNFQTEVTNEKIPTENPMYQFVLDVMHPGMKHIDFVNHIDKSYELTRYALQNGVTFDELAVWYRKNGFDKDADKAIRRKEKIATGKGIMAKNLVVPKFRIGAFVGHYPTNLTHHREDRFLTYRECMSIMGLPENFELLNPKKNLNHVCQNVPFQTAKDMATEVRSYLEGKLPMLDANLVFQNNHNHTHEIMDEKVNSLEGFFG